jgi:hypothetical protein
MAASGGAECGQDRVNVSRLILLDPVLLSEKRPGSRQRRPPRVRACGGLGRVRKARSACVLLTYTRSHVRAMRDERSGPCTREVDHVPGCAKRHA